MTTTAWMQLFSYKTIRGRLILLVMISVVALASVVIAGWYGGVILGRVVISVGSSNEALDSLMMMRQAQLQSTLAVRDSLSWVNDNRGSNSVNVLAEARNVFADSAKRYHNAAELALSASNNYEKIYREADEERKWQELKGNWDLFLQSAKRNDEIFNQLATVQDQTSYQQLVDKLDSQSLLDVAFMEALSEQLPLLLDATRKISRLAIEESVRVRASYNLVMGTCFVIALTLLVFLAWQIVRSVMKSLEYMQLTIARVSQENDFTARMMVSGDDEISETGKAFNSLLERIQKVLSQVLLDAKSIDEFSHATNHASGQVVRFSVNQQDATQHMSDSISEMNTLIQASTVKAGETLRLAEQVGSAASEGGETIAQTSAEMAGIVRRVASAARTIEKVGDQSNQISSIMEVIKEIADQTNLLALNAAIEAARAGEQGRGFAVVADEVRKLAERTSQATEEIREMIVKMQESSGKAVADMSFTVDLVNHGKTLSDKANEHIQLILSCAREVNLAVSHMNDALTTQSQAATEIMDQVSSVTSMAEENSRISADTEKISNDLLTVASRLERAVKSFRL